MKYKILPILAVVFWMVFIFYLSHQPASVSNGLSKGITEAIVTTIEKVVPNQEFDIRYVNHVIRKNAHFLAYFVLGFLAMYALGRFKLKRYKWIGLAILVGVLYAISDEVHQLFVPGRGGQLKDVLIDSAGVLAGVGVYIIGKRIKKALRRQSQGIV